MCIGLSTAVAFHGQSIGVAAHAERGCLDFGFAGKTRTAEHDISGATIQCAIIAVAWSAHDYVVIAVAVDIARRTDRSTQATAKAEARAKSSDRQTVGAIQGQDVADGEICFH